MRVLICGGRDFQDEQHMDRVLQQIDNGDEVTTVISGAARGADTLGELWAKRHGKATEVYPADWSKYGLSAGPRRNQEMLVRGKPDLVVAFRGGKGTADMIRRARKAKVRVIEA